MPWDEQDTLERFDDSHLDRLNTAEALLSATGWIDHLARLVAIDTTFPASDGYGPFTDALQDLFAPLGFGLRRIEPPESLWRANPAAASRVSLLATRRTGRPVCSIPCYMDTRPPGPGWTRPPLMLTRQGSILFGRGTAGMKGAIVALWAALRAADAVGLPLRFDPLLLFTTEGKGGRFSGLRALAEQGWLEGHLLYLNGYAAPRIWSGSLGSFDLEIRISRCADVPDAPSVARVMRPVLVALADLQNELEQRSSRLVAAPERGRAPLRPGLSFLSVGAETEPEGKQPLGVLVLRRHFTSEEGFGAAVDELKARVEQAVEAAGYRCMVECRVLQRVDAVTDPDQGPNLPSWQRALSWGFGFPSGRFRRFGDRGSSGLGFVQQAGIQEILFGGLRRPGQLSSAPNEHTTVEDVEALARALLAYLADLPEVPDPC